MRRQTVRLVTTTRSTISITATNRPSAYCPTCGHFVETIRPDEWSAASSGPFGGGLHELSTAGGETVVCRQSVIGSGR